MPDQIRGERLVASAATVTPPEHARGPIPAGEVVDDGIVGDPVWHAALMCSPPGDTLIRVGRVARNVVRARRDRNGCVDLPLGGFQLDLLLRAGLCRTQPRIRALRGQEHDLVAELGVELRLEALAGVTVAP